MSSPAKGVSKFHEKRRQHLVTDDKYDALIAAAVNSSTPSVIPFIDITYLCGLRRYEALRLNIKDIATEGLIIRRGKGSSDEITQISEQLLMALEFAISLHKPDAPEPIKSRPLLHNTRGHRIATSAINQAFSEVRASCGLDHVWIHDLKKKAGSDGKDLGHKTQSMRDLYNLKPAVKRPTR